MRNPSSATSSAVQRGVGLDDRVVSSTRKTKATVALCSKMVGMKRGPWTPEEDELLSTYINREGHGRWRTLPKRAGLLRCGKSCRLRWMNYLRPSVKRGHIAPDEEDLILRLHRLLGNRWSLIAGRLPGRTDNEIKNYWNTHLSKKLIRQGIDPRTHKQLLSSSLDLNTITTAADPHNIIINNTTTYNQYVDSSDDCLNKFNLTTVSPIDLYQVPTHENKDFRGYLGAMHLQNQIQAKGKGHLTKEEVDVSIDVEGDDNDDENIKTYANNNDVFSLFFSSVINYEELIKGVGGQQQQHDDHEPAGNALIPASRSTALNAFASGTTGWDAPMMRGFF